MRDEQDRSPRGTSDRNDGSANIRPVRASSDHDDVTVVIPCFNYGRFLPEALHSVRGQDGGSPVIVVDDGSTEPRRRRCSRRCRRTRRTAPGRPGPSAARNAGFRPDTPLLLALDADDMLPPRALAAMKAGLESDPSAGFAYGVMEFFGAWSGKLTMPEWDPYRLLYRHTIGANGADSPRAVDDVGGFDPEIRGYEDWELWLHALAKGWHGVRVPAVTVLYRQQGRDQFHVRQPRVPPLVPGDPSKARRPLRPTSELARESDLGVVGRGVYRFYWGPRPVPAAGGAPAVQLLWGRRAR